MIFYFVFVGIIRLAVVDEKKEQTCASDGLFNEATSAPLDPNNTKSFGTSSSTFKIFDNGFKYLKGCVSQYLPKLSDDDVLMDSRIKNQYISLTTNAVGKFHEDQANELCTDDEQAYRNDNFTFHENSDDLKSLEQEHPSIKPERWTHVKINILEHDNPTFFHNPDINTDEFIRDALRESSEDEEVKSLQNTKIPPAVKPKPKNRYCILFSEQDNSAKDLGILNKPSKTENGPEFTIWSKSSDKSKDELEKSKDELEKSKDNLDKSKDELEKSKDNLDKSKDELEKSATNTNPTGKYMPVANCYYSNYIKQIVNQRNPKDSFSKKRDVFEHKESD